MTEKHQQLSAWVDGEVQQNEADSKTLIASTLSDAELAGKWQRYHLIRQSLRKEVPDEIDTGLSVSIAQALEQEPTILAPKRKGWRELPVVAAVLPMARQGGQFAIAASVAVAAIIGVQQLSQPDVVEPFSAAPTLFSPQGGLSPVSLDSSRTISQPSALNQRQMMNAYLQDHQMQMRLRSSVKAVDEQATSTETSEKSPEQPE